MAIGAYIGVNGIARKVTKIYVGVNNVARQVPKAFVGISNVARLFFSGTATKKVSNVTPLVQARAGLASASTQNYLIFAGGRDSSGNCNFTDAYNSTLTRTNPTYLSTARRKLAGGVIGSYALFAGGAVDGNSISASPGTETTNVVETYNSQLTKSTATSLSQSRSGLVSANTSSYLLFGGGGYNSAGSSYNYPGTVDVYNSSLTRTLPQSGLSGVYSNNLAATSVGNYAIFAGGWTSYTGITNYVNAYDNSLTKYSPTGLSVSRGFLAGGSIGNYALFAGGMQLYNNSSISSSTVDVYDSYLTRMSTIYLTHSSAGLASAKIKNKYLLFGGGSGSPDYSSVVAYKYVNSFDSNLTKTIEPLLNDNGGGDYIAGGSIGNYAVFAGGRTAESSNWHYNNIVDAYF